VNYDINGGDKARQDIKLISLKIKKSYFKNAEFTYMFLEDIFG